MAGGIEFEIVGKITYYTMVIYLLFIVGLIIVCRHIYKSHREKKRKKSNEQGRPVAEKADECKEMGLFHSKKKYGYNVDNGGNLNKRNVPKYTRHEGDRPSTSDNRPTSSNRDNSTIKNEDEKLKKVSLENKKAVNKSHKSDSCNNTEKLSYESSNIGLEKELKTSEVPHDEKYVEEITNNLVTSANQNQLKSTIKRADTSIFPKKTEIAESKGESDNQVPDNIENRGGLSCFADGICSEIVQVAYCELDKKILETRSNKDLQVVIPSLAESIVNTTLHDGLAVVENQKKLSSLASEYAARIIADMLSNDKLLITLRKALKLKKEPSVKMRRNAEKTSLTYCKSIVDNVYKEASLHTRNIGHLSENLSSVIVESAINSSVSHHHPAKASKTKKAAIVDGNTSFAQHDIIDSYSEQFAEKVLDNALDDACSSVSKPNNTSKKVLPTVQVFSSEEDAKNTEGSLCKFSLPNDNLLDVDASDKGIAACKYNARSECGYASSESDVEKDSKSPVVLRNKSLLKIKLHTDRPLSSYAEQLAGFLADDDDSLTLFESDDEFDAVLDKMEQKYGDDEKLNTKIQKRRRQSESRLGPLRSPSYENEQRGRIASTQSSCSVASSTDTDDVLRGSTSEDHLLSPGFSKFDMKTTVVIDTGCGVIKAGMAGEIGPRCELPSVVGVPRRFSQDVSKMDRGYYVGQEAIIRAGMLQLDHPIKQEVTNWSDVQSLIEYVAEVELNVSLNDHPVLLTETGLTSKKQREKFTEVMFERNRVPAFFLANQGPLSLYSMGLMSGFCLNSGFETTQMLPVYDGHVLPYCSRRLDIGGHQISNYLGRMLLSGKGLAFSSSSEKFLLDDIKRSLCYVAQDPKTEQERNRKFHDQVSKIFTLPDGQEIDVDVERFECSEILFDPEIIGLEQKPIHSLLLDSIASANSSLQPTLMNNVIVSGGTTLLPGFTDRLRKELNSLTDRTADVRLTNASSPTTAAWIGGSVISSRSTFSQQCITADEYAEYGVTAVHMKCF